MLPRLEPYRFVSVVVLIMLHLTARQDIILWGRVFIQPQEIIPMNWVVKSMSILGLRTISMEINIPKPQTPNLSLLQGLDATFAFEFYPTSPEESINSNWGYIGFWDYTL